MSEKQNKTKQNKNTKQKKQTNKQTNQKKHTKKNNNNNQIVKMDGQCKIANDDWHSTETKI